MTQQIPDLDPATALDGTEVFPARQGSTDKKVTIDQVQARFDPFFESADPDILKADTPDELTAGFDAAPHDAGIKSSGTYTPDAANGNLQFAVNGGAHALAPPANNTTLIVQYTNNASAGAVTTSGFTKVDGAFTTTNGDDFLAYISKVNGFSHLNIVAMQ